jgi:hypothetical protein
LANYFKKGICWLKSIITGLLKLGVSHFWAELMATKKIFFRLGTFSIKDGLENLLWGDRWLGNTTIRNQYHMLYNIVHHRSDTVATVIETSPPNVTFRRDLSGQRCVYWNANAKFLSTPCTMY